MSLTKLSQVTYLPGTLAQPAQAYSRTCPSPPPITYPSNLGGGSSGGSPSNCVLVPVYCGQEGNPTAVCGYQWVCS